VQISWQHDRGDAIFQHRHGFAKDRAARVRRPIGGKAPADARKNSSAEPWSQVW
jgi:hypothetical protein